LGGYDKLINKVKKINMNLEEAKNVLQSYLMRGGKDERHKNWQKVVEDMSIHLDGVFPAKLIESRRPNEDNERYNYRKNNFATITMPSVLKALDSLYMIMNEAYYTMSISNSLQKYIDQNIFGNIQKMDFLSYIQQVVLINMIRDPNSLLAVIPSDDVKSIALNPLIENRSVNPLLEYVPSANIIEYTEDLLIFESMRKTSVYYRKSVQQKGRIVYIMDKTHIYKAQQIGNYSLQKYDVELLYEHNIGEIPVTVLGGIYNATLDCNESYFKGFIPFANEALRQYSDWQATMVTSAFPIREIKPIDCDADGCVDGYIEGPNGSKYVCGKCNGTGKIAPIGPYGVIISEKVNRILDDQYDDRPPIRFHAPDTRIIEYAQNAWETLLEKGEKALFLDRLAEPRVSGVAMEIHNSFEGFRNLRISDNIYEMIIYNSLKYMELMRNINNPQMPRINKPTHFGIKSQKELFDEYAKLKNANANDNLMRAVTEEIFSKRYGGSQLMILSNNFQMEKDILYFKSQEDKISLYNAGIISSRQIAYSLYLPAILDKLIRETSDPILLFDDYNRLEELCKLEFENIYQVELGD
jgi:hypothetical protein